MAKSKDIVDDVKKDEVKPDEEIKNADIKDNASNEDLTGKDESKDIDSTEENQEDKPEIKDEKPEESKPDEEENPVNDGKSPVNDGKEENKPEIITLDEVKPDDLPPIEVIDSNNKPINNDAIGDVGVPQGFAPLPKNKKIGKMGNSNGRLYKIINDNYAIWCDNGAAFPLSNLK